MGCDRLLVHVEFLHSPPLKGDWVAAFNHFNYSRFGRLLNRNQNDPDDAQIMEANEVTADGHSWIRDGDLYVDMKEKPTSHGRYVEVEWCVLLGRFRGFRSILCVKCTTNTLQYRSSQYGRIYSNWILLCKERCYSFKAKKNSEYFVLDGFGLKDQKKEVCSYC